MPICVEFVQIQITHKLFYDKFFLLKYSLWKHKKRQALLVNVDTYMHVYWLIELYLIWI